VNHDAIALCLRPRHCSRQPETPAQWTLEFLSLTPCAQVGVNLLVVQPLRGWVAKGLTLYQRVAEPGGTAFTLAAREKP